MIVLAQRYVPANAARLRGPLDVSRASPCTRTRVARRDGRTDAPRYAGRVGRKCGDDYRGSARGSVRVPRARARSSGAPKRPSSRRNCSRRGNSSLTYALEVLDRTARKARSSSYPPRSLLRIALTPVAAGGIAAIGAFMFVAVIPLAGRGLDAFGSRAVLLVTGATLTAARARNLRERSLRRCGSRFAGIVVAGIGFGALLGAPTRYIITNEVPRERRATAVGLLSVFLIIGQIFGGSLAGGAVGSRIDDADAYRLAYEIFAALGVVAALGALQLASRAQERKAPV